jgi:hypothetical protein
MGKAKAITTKTRRARRTIAVHSPRPLAGGGIKGGGSAWVERTAWQSSPSPANSPSRRRAGENHVGDGGLNNGLNSPFVQNLHFLFGLPSLEQRVERFQICALAAEGGAELLHRFGIAAGFPGVQGGFLFAFGGSRAGGGEPGLAGADQVRLPLPFFLCPVTHGETSFVALLRAYRNIILLSKQVTGEGGWR